MMKKFLRRILFLVIYNFRIRKTLKKEVAVKVRGIYLKIPPSVFNPVFFTTSKFLAEYVSLLDLRNKKVLDAGTGSGILAITAAHKHAIVTAVDINPAAVECAEANAKRNHALVTVLQSNWFDRIGEQKFDMIISNPPFIKGKPHPPYGIAWYCGERYELVYPLIAQCAEHLEKGGYALFVFSSDTDIRWFVEQLALYLPKIQIAAKRDSFFEEFQIVKAIRE